MIPNEWKRCGSLALFALLATLGCQSVGSSQAAARPDAARGQADQRFDLLVYGLDLNRGDHEVFLRTNLDFGHEWESIGRIAADGASGDRWGTAVFPGLSGERFLGQDVRENYVDVRIVTTGGADGAHLAALYAMPHAPRARGGTAQVTRLIEDDPTAVERRSFMSLVHPKPVALRAGAEYVGHVIGSVKHSGPGIKEVEQLKIEWRNRP